MMAKERGWHKAACTGKNPQYFIKVIKALLNCYNTDEPEFLREYDTKDKLPPFVTREKSPSFLKDSILND